MCILFYLALTMFYLPVVNSLAASGDFGKQGQEWKTYVCLHMRNCNNNSNELLKLLLQKNMTDLKDRAADKVFNLQDPENVTSVVDLYRELTTYTRIFHIFNSSMATHKQTEIFKRANKKTKQYFERLSKTVIELNHTTDKIMELNLSFHQASENTIFVDAGCLTTPHFIETCSYYVTEKLTKLLDQWETNCPTRLSSRKRISSGKKGRKGKKNKGNKKDKKRGGDGGKGKGKEKQKKNASNKRNKSQETKTQ